MMRDIRYYPERDGLERFGLGPTEAELMDYLWSCTCPRTLAQIAYYRANGRAKNTIMTTLNRLVKKGLLTRTKLGTEHFRYAPVEPRTVWEARIIAAVKQSLG